ncbi:MAG: sigma-54 dependent transcriptional regulator [Mariprofundaceae bacterium]|nr:sigma-54 dependent transcriptional regulator [Mariprofundaceae bacterium]
MTQHILIVDDEQPIRESLQDLFEDEGYATQCASSGEEAVARYRQKAADCVLLDIWMPGIDGLETLSRIRQMDSDVPIIMMSGHATIDTAVRATQKGAFDFLEKPLSSDRLLILVRNALEKRKLTNENLSLKQRSQTKQRSELIGKTPAIKKAIKQIQRFAGMDASVLIHGEHGTGKATVAKMLHEQSTRSGQEFVDINLAAIPRSRMEDELFGHDKSIAHKMTQQTGKLEKAHHGSMFFNEVELLNPALQIKVLRVLQQKKLHRLGHDSIADANIRLIAATSIDLQQAMQRQVIREDFYYHLSVAVIELPALRHRKEDIPLLIQHFTTLFADKKSQNSIQFHDDVLQQLQLHPWHGNIRELRNYIERCHIMLPGKNINLDNMIPLTGASQPKNHEFTDSFHAAKENFERNYLLHNLKKHQWNISRTAAHVGMERTQLYRKIKSFNLKEGQE